MRDPKFLSTIYNNQDIYFQNDLSMWQHKFQQNSPIFLIGGQVLHLSQLDRLEKILPPKCLPHDLGDSSAKFNLKSSNSCHDTSRRGTPQFERTIISSREPNFTLRRDIHGIDLDSIGIHHNMAPLTAFPS
jgi:hypothetical protein